LALTNASKKWTMPIKNWAMALNQFAILCDTNLQIWANGEIILTQTF
jgi:transposase-like protein